MQNEFQNLIDDRAKDCPQYNCSLEAALKLQEEERKEEGRREKARQDREEQVLALSLDHDPYEALEEQPPPFSVV